MEPWPDSRIHLFLLMFLLMLSVSSIGAWRTIRGSRRPWDIMATLSFCLLLILLIWVFYPAIGR